ncbi:ABC transporter permease [Stappia sp. 28M-7]|jgi:peptide/nickel transport system permease protein|uniref:ABC transporter permease n=1 Tax=Stappia sp. 28M-7 TaxID=2762596 RepID=UPI000E7538C2|nr:ABC transporter permease [Stappia sp. 28M-7]MBC2858473.1 ABC transporter permease [Stappia sp. 28M-7]
MWAYALKRVISAIPILILASIMVFGLMRLIPGDPALLFIGDIDDPAALEAKRRELGLDQSLVTQYLTWAAALLRGDFGVSVQTGRAVLDEIRAAFPVTAIVVLTATVIAGFIAIPAGIVAGWKQNTKTDASIVGIATLCLSVPGFWTALLLLTFFGAKWKLLPTVGYVSVFEDPAAGMIYLIMPVVALVLTEVAVLTRMSRASTIEVMGLEYVTHARAKGVGEGRLLRRHVFPNAFAPTLTVLGLILGHLLGGVVVIEQMFSLPGLGRLMVNAIFARDYAVVQGVLIFIVAIYVAINTIIDLLYPVFDPRVKL